MILISDDGRSAVVAPPVQPRTGKTVGKAGDFFGASFWGGMYHDQYVLEDGIWRIWKLTLDEPYINPVAWKDSVWAKSKIRIPGPARTFRGGKFPPDIPLTSLGKREEHFRGGTGETRSGRPSCQCGARYTNPVSGRVPELSGTMRALRGASRAEARSQRLSEAAGCARSEQDAITPATDRRGPMGPLTDARPARLNR